MDNLNQDINQNITPEQGKEIPIIEALPSQEKVSLTPAKPNEGKFLLLIIGAAVLAVLIPLTSYYLVKKQTVPTTSQQRTIACSSIKITDTKNKDLTTDDLKNLRPNDEIKFVIASTNPNAEKARFRVNGSQWMETINKENNNFIGNYILAQGISKFIIESEIFDKEKGWQ